MSNLFQSFVKLIDDKKQDAGEISALASNGFVVNLIGGGTVVCRGNSDYKIGDKVIINGLKIESKVPDLEMVEIIIY